jgi:hypothetical protein
MTALTRKIVRGKPFGGSGWRSIPCSGACGKKVTVSDSVKWVLCGKCQNGGLTKLREKKEKEQG